MQYRCQLGKINEFILATDCGSNSKKVCENVNNGNGCETFDQWQKKKKKFQ